MLLHENSHGVKMIREDKVKRSAINDFYGFINDFISGFIIGFIMVS